MRKSRFSLSFASVGGRGGPLSETFRSCSSGATSMKSQPETAQLEREQTPGSENVGEIIPVRGDVVGVTSRISAYARKSVETALEGLYPGSVSFTRSVLVSPGSRKTSSRKVTSSPSCTSMTWWRL